MGNPLRFEEQIGNTTGQNYGSQKAASRSSLDGAFSAGLIEIRNEQATWDVTMLPVRNLQGQLPSFVAPNPTIENTRAIVEWANGGVKASAIVDWPMQGGTFQITGNSLFVIGGCSVNGIGLQDQPQLPEVQFAAFAARAGSRVAPPPRRTVFYGDLVAFPGPGNQLTLPVPLYARRWQWTFNQTMYAAAWVFRFEFRDYLTNPVAVYGLRPGPTGEQNYMVDVHPMEVPIAATTLTVINEGAAASVGHRVAYDLDIG